MPDSPPSPPRNDVGNNSFIDENDRQIPYTQLPRLYGDGELRIGTFLSLEEDIYSLGFASLYKNELVDLALLKDEGVRPKSQYLPAQTPRGSYIVQKAGTEGDDFNGQD